MKPIDFPESNTTLGAGMNSNTRPIRIALCKNAEMPKYKNAFIVSKWEMDDDEKAQFKDSIAKFLEPELVEEVVKNLPPVFLSAMGSMFPVMVMQCSSENVFNETFLMPDDDRAAKVNSTRIGDN